MPLPPRKVIQKRLKKKERYAKMVRTRKRNQTDFTLAQVQPIQKIVPFEDNTRFYGLPLGFVIGEKNNKLGFDISMLNKIFVSASVDITNDENALFSVKFSNKSAGFTPLTEEVLDEWEQRDDPYWSKWATMMRQCLNKYEEFLEKNEDKFLHDDKEAIKKYEQHNARRAEMAKNRPFMEIRNSFDLEESRCIEVILNQKLLSLLNYDCRELAEIVMSRGMPKVNNDRVNDQDYLGGMLLNFFKAFDKPLSVQIAEDLIMRREGQIKRMKVDYLITGTIYKRMGELSLIRCFQEIDQIPMVISPAFPLSEMFFKLQTVKKAERNLFLMKFYPGLYVEMNKISQKGSPLCIKNETESLNTGNGNRLSDKETESGHIKEEYEEF